MWETGARPGEYLDLKIGDIEDRKKGKKVVVKGKTGSRRLPLLSSVPYLNAWLGQHPAGNERDAPLWCRLDEHPHERIDYDYFRNLLRDIAETAVEVSSSASFFTSESIPYVSKTLDPTVVEN